MTWIPSWRFPRPATILLTAAAFSLSACSGMPDWLPGSGPDRSAVVEAASSDANVPVMLVDVSDAVARRLIASQRTAMFSEVFGTQSSASHVVGSGDVVEVSIWEAPPATLFGGGNISTTTDGISTSRVNTLPEQMVGSDGSINVPFAGSVPAAGLLPRQIEAEVVRRLTGKANEPQVLVRVVNNATANVTVVGEVASGKRMPLTAKGERLLDALAAAGGARQAVDKTTVQLTRGPVNAQLPLETVIENPEQNVALRAGDVVTVLYQPASFTVLGATGKNEEINFEAQGISLAQALARAGGVQDQRADARGVFLFRFEEPRTLGVANPPHTTPEGKVPVIYRADLSSPDTFFVAQNFPVRDDDVLYVSNAPAAELQKFLSIVSSAVYPALGITANAIAISE